MQNITAIGDNPQQPMASAESYIPDQLIAGTLHLVTRNVTLFGTAALLRGTVLGATKYGSVAASAGTTFAHGSITGAAQPTAGDTLTIFGTVITFVAPAPFVKPQGNQVAIGATLAATMQNLLAFLTGSTDTNLVKATYSLAALVLTATAIATGTGGNALTLATSDTSAFTLSGSTLSGGVNNTGNATVGTMAAGLKAKAGNYLAVCTAATTAQVYDPDGEEIGVAAFGTQFTDPQISFKITAGGTPCVAGDTFVIAAAPAAAGLYTICTAGAIDGSEEPAAILADYSDPTSGNVTAGVYQMGEFNANAAILDPSLSLAAVRAVLDRRGIFLKSSVSAADPS